MKLEQKIDEYPNIKAAKLIAPYLILKECEPQTNHDQNGWWYDNLFFRLMCNVTDFLFETYTKAERETIDEMWKKIEEINKKFDQKLYEEGLKTREEKYAWFIVRGIGADLSSFICLSDGTSASLEFEIISKVKNVNNEVRFTKDVFERLMGLYVKYSLNDAYKRFNSFNHTNNIIVANAEEFKKKAHETLLQSLYAQKESNFLDGIKIKNENNCIYAKRIAKPKYVEDIVEQ